MKSSSEWSTIEIVSTPNEDADNLYNDLTISHDGKQDVKLIAKYLDINKLMKYSIGEVIAEYIDEYL